MEGCGIIDSTRAFRLAAMVLLGLGPDAHICSLFPGASVLGERERRVVGVETPGMAPLVSRITLTLPVVNSSRQSVFLVTGDDKAEAIRRVFAGRPDPDRSSTPPGGATSRAPLRECRVAPRAVPRRSRRTCRRRRAGRRTAR